MRLDRVLPVAVGLLVGLLYLGFGGSIGPIDDAVAVQPRRPREGLASPSHPLPPIASAAAIRPPAATAPEASEPKPGTQPTAEATQAATRAQLNLQSGGGRGALPQPEQAGADPAEQAAGTMGAGSECALRWRPGITPRLTPPLNASESAWERAEGAGRRRLDAFFAKLLRGESVTVYFLGESVTRGTGASHACLTCADARPPAPGAQRHDWVNQSLLDRGLAGRQYASLPGERPPSCPAERAQADPYQSCSNSLGGGGAAPSTPGGAELADSLKSPGGGCLAEGRVCFPRNSWRCLVLHWLQHAFPGQVTMRTSAKPLLFMASCFAASLAEVDLVVHEYAVNGGGRMLCLQERVLRAALQGPEWPAVLELLWIPKHFLPGPPKSILIEVQANLAALGAHYSLPTLQMQRAFSAPCAHHTPGRDPTLASWCYTRNSSRHGEEGMLHGDMYHPNVDGHAFFASHILELLERSALFARRTASLAPPTLGGLGPPPLSERTVLPAALHELNRGLDSTGEGGKNLCLAVGQMAALATSNKVPPLN